MIGKLRLKAKEQKGFTLIELLAVIVILGIIAAIAIPSVMKVIDNSKKDSFVSDAQQFLNSAKTAANDKNLIPTDGNNEYITLGYLKDNQYIDLNKDPDGGVFATEDTTADPSSESPAEDVSYVEITNNAGKISYTVQLIGSKRKVTGEDPTSANFDRDDVTPVTVN